MTNERSSMIDWDTAVCVGARLAGDGPSVSRGRGRRRGRRAARRRRPVHPPGPRVHRPVAEERTAPVLVVDRPGWIQANADGFAESRPADRQAAGEEGPARPRSPQAIGSRITGAEVGAAARLPGRQGARPVRPVPRGPASRPAAAGRAEHRPRRARARASTRTTSGSGSACTRRPTGCSSPPSLDARPPPERDAGDRRTRSSTRPVRDARDAVRRTATLVNGQGRGQPARPDLQPRSRRRSSTGSPA